MGMIKEAVIEAMEQVKREPNRYIGWILDEDGEPVLDLFANVLMTDYPDEFEQIAKNDSDAYDTYAMQFLSLSEDMTMEFTYSIQDGQTYCELYEIENDPNEAYTEI